MNGRSDGDGRMDNAQGVFVCGLTRKFLVVGAFTCFVSVCTCSQGEAQKRQGSAHEGPGGEGEGGAGGEAALPTKRRRTNVDYVALQKKLQVKSGNRNSRETKHGHISLIVVGGGVVVG